jgi:hypothetical protein
MKLSARHLLLVSGIALAAPLFAHAENCAQLNAATAGGLMGVEASLKLEHMGATDTVCTFTPQQGDSGAELQITVHTLTDIHEEYKHYAEMCKSEATSMRAVGNEAVECSSRSSNGMRVETVVGRVRNRAFVLLWTIPNPETGPNAFSQEMVREKMRNLAEQVAGSMF